MMFETNWKRNHHMRAVHVFKSFECGKCDKKFKTKNQLEIHVKSIHEGVKYNCTICPYQANRKDNLKYHINSVHKRERNWNCKVCPFSTYQKSNFKAHMRVHTVQNSIHKNKSDMPETSSEIEIIPLEDNELVKLEETTTETETSLHQNDDEKGILSTDPSVYNDRSVHF